MFTDFVVCVAGYLALELATIVVIFATMAYLTRHLLGKYVKNSGD